MSPNLPNMCYHDSIIDILIVANELSQLLWYFVNYIFGGFYGWVSATEYLIVAKDWQGNDSFETMIDPIMYWYNAINAIHI